MRLNYMGCVYVAKEVAARMVKAGRRGSITLVSSVAGIIGFLGYGSYTPSKFAVRGLAGEWRCHRIRFSFILILISTYRFSHLAHQIR